MQILCFLMIVFVSLPIWGQHTEGIKSDENQSINNLDIPSPPNGELTEQLPFRFYPNPATENVTVEFRLTLPAKVTVTLVSISGESLRILADELFPPGKHFLQTTLTKIPIGVYLIKYETNNIKKTQKLRVVN